ncbi:hypothetical protein ACHAW6_006108 [Cyclotella cf. meneghiniana]
MRTEWDEDDHLLDEMLEDDVGNDVDGWDEELTGLSSDEDAMPAGASLDRISNDDAATSVDPAAAVNQCVPIAATESRSEQEENAWDFESDLVLDDDNNESSAASSVEAAAAVTKTTEPAASEHCALAESMEGKDEMNNNQVLQKLEANQKQVNAMTQRTRFDQASTEATRIVDTNVAADRHLTSNNCDINGNHHVQSNHQNGEKYTNNDQNEWDFEDDIFNDENNALPDNVSSEVASAFENKGQENKADNPPPPPPPSVQKTNAIGDEPPPPPPPSSHLLQGKPLVHSISQEQNITNPFLSQDKSATSRGHNADNMQDQDGDGWSDDEAFFNDDDMENLPVVPSKALSKAPPLPPSAAHHHNLQQQQEAELPFTDPTQIKIHQMILTYLSNISNPQFLPRLNSKVDSPNNTAAINLREYYATRPGLKKYTLGVELDRMDYTILLPGGKCLDDKDVIRSYFGVGPDGSSGGHEPENTTPSLEEILIRSANQSLLADALVALTGSEEVLLDSSDEFHNHGDVGMSLILSGPMLSMTSVAESCDFVVDLEKGAVEATCVLAIVVPFHHGDSNEVDQRIVDKGQLVLARTRVSVRFCPGNGGMNGNDESTAQYVVHSVEPSFFCPDESTLIRRAAISLALDQNDPFFHGDEMLHRQQEESTTDVRDLFLLNHHLLSDSHLLAVSDHLVRLRGAAEASSTGFRSALRQLDGVTNVSGKLSLIKNATGGGGGGIGGFLALPSAQEIEAAEREAADTVVFANAGPGGRFPRPPNNQYHREVQSHGLRPPPPPPPPIPPKTSGQAGQDGSRPRPLIGGMFLSGLSRLAAAATQPDNDHRNLQWPEGGGTGLTPPSSPPRDSYSSQARNQPHALYRGDEHSNSSYSIPQWDGTTGGTGLTPSTVHPSHNESTLMSSRTHSNARPFFSHSFKLKDETKVVCQIHEKETMEDGDEKDGGWSDDGLDFDDEDQDNYKLDHEDPWEDSLEIQENAKSVPVVSNSSSTSDSNHLSPSEAPTLNNDHMLPSLHSTTKHHAAEASLKFLEASLQPPRQPRQIAKQRPESTASFEEEFVMVLKEKIEEEEREMRETGRMKRWRPISEDPIRRQRLMEVMVNQLDGHY